MNIFGPKTATTEELYKHARMLVETSNFPSERLFISIFGEDADEALTQIGIKVLPETVATAFINVATKLFRAELATTALPLPLDPVRYGTVHEGRHRDKLLLIIHRLTEVNETLFVIRQALLDLFTYFLGYVPKQFFVSDSAASPLATLPLKSVLTSLPSAVSACIVPFLDPETEDKMTELRLFSDLRKTLNANLNAISDKKITWPTSYEGEVSDIVSVYLRDTPLIELFQPEVPFSIPEETRFSGHWIIAPPGRGKTTLLQSMFLNDLSSNASIIVMDSKGDLINPIKSMAAVADRLVLIEPDSSHPLALNPLDVPSENIPHTIALIEYILSGLLEAKFTNLQSALFRQVLPSMLQAFEHPTLETLKRVLADGLTKEEMARLDDRLRSFFEDKSHGFHAKTYAETRSQIIWRLDFILTNDTMRAMFASPTTRLKIGEAMNSGKIILIDASKAKLGDDGSEFYQRFFLALILGAAQARSTLKPSEKLPVYCYLDECQWVRNDQKLATILDECRSQKIALILAHQRTDQITNINVLSAMSNCAIRFANSDDEAKYLAPKLRCDPAFLCSLPRGSFAAFVRDLTPHAIALSVAYRDIGGLPRMTVAQQATIRRRMSDDYGFVPVLAPIRTEVSVSPVAEALEEPTESTAQASSDKSRSAATRRDDRPPPSDKPETGSTW